MTAASEIRKRVREAERERVKAREGAAVAVAQAHERVEAARATLAGSEADLRTAVAEATSRHGFTVGELATITGVSRSALRTAIPSKRSGGSNTDPAEASALSV